MLCKDKKLSDNETQVRGSYFCFSTTYRRVFSKFDMASPLSFEAISDHLSSSVNYSISMQARNQDQANVVDEGWGESEHTGIYTATCTSSNLQTNQSRFRPRKVERKTMSTWQSLASLELLNCYGNRLKRLNGSTLFDPRSEQNCRTLSTVEIIQVSRGMLSQPFSKKFTGEEIKDIELVQVLIRSAEKVYLGEYEGANKLLSQCDLLSCATGNPVQRVVYHFSEVLRQKIDLELNGYCEKLSFDVTKTLMTMNFATLAYYQEVPLYQVGQVAAVEVIIENIARATRVHIIDLSIRCGLHWTILMQALVSQHESSLQHFKITATGVHSKEMEETGKRLTTFAKTLNLSFSFSVVTISDVLDLKKDKFEIHAEEVIVVYSEFFLSTVNEKPPSRLDSLMTVMRDIRPSIMVVIEIESNLSSPDFLDRFIEGLLLSSVHLDCIDTCMTNKQYRTSMESVLSQGIKKLVVTEEEKGRASHVTLDVWRSLFSSFGMEEKKFSISSLDQGNMVTNNFAQGKFCTLDRNGKSLIIRWKGAPIHSLSAWKFL